MRVIVLQLVDSVALRSVRTGSALPGWYPFSAVLLQTQPIPAGRADARKGSWRGSAPAPSMAPRPPLPAASAPDLIGPRSIVSWPLGGPAHRTKDRRPFAHVHLEVDLEPEVVRAPSIPVLRQVERLLREREVVEVGDLLRLTAALLHALAAVGFRRVDHWEVEPGGWLPLPEESHTKIEEPIGHFLRALANDSWRGLAARRSFALRLSGPAGVRLDAVARFRHRERSHSLSLDLRGSIPPRFVEQTAGALRSHLRVLRVHVTEFTRRSAG